MSRVIKARELAVKPRPFLIPSDLQDALEAGAQETATYGDDDDPTLAEWNRDGAEYDFDQPEEEGSSEPGEPESPEALAARDLIAEARAEAERIVAEAAMQAKRLEEEARQAAIAIREEARNEGQASGRESGLRQGIEEGLKAVRAELAETVAQATRLLDECQVARSRILSSSRDDVLKIVRKCAEKIIRANVQLDSDTVARVIHDSLQLVTEKSKLLIRVNPSEVARAREEEAHFLQFLPGSTQLEIMGDNGIEPGGCFIEAVAGSVDARVETQLDELMSRLEGALNAG